jgi:hypothetical protein
MDMEIDIKLIVDILELKDLLNNAIELNHPGNLIQLYRGMINNKTAELKLLQSIEGI